MVNFRENVRGHLFQERFHSFPVTRDRHLLALVRYVERNPVRAMMVERADQYPWSSARFHVQGKDDPLVRSRALLDGMVSKREDFESLPASSVA